MRRHSGLRRMSGLEAEHGVYTFPGTGGRLVIFDVATGKELAAYWSRSMLLYPTGRPARRVPGLAAAIRLAAEMKRGVA